MKVPLRLVAIVAMTNTLSNHPPTPISEPGTLGVVTVLLPVETGLPTASRTHIKVKTDKDKHGPKFAHDGWPSTKASNSLARSTSYVPTSAVFRPSPPAVTEYPGKIEPVTLNTI